MITEAESAAIRERAYVLEHVPGYVSAITGLDPLLFADHVLYRSPEVLVVVGYPLDGRFEPTRLDRLLDDAIDRFSPGVVSVVAPRVPPRLAGGEHEPPDDYYRLALADFTPGQKVRNMVNRARRELTVERVRAHGREHERLVRAFLKRRPLGEGHRYLFERLSAYVAGGTARVYEARDAKGRLAAFDVAEFEAARYAFYAFNFRGRRGAVPGASDLLLQAVIDDAQAEGKTWLGLGLGISPGVAFFKRKWGGVPYLRHVGSRLERETGGAGWA